VQPEEVSQKDDEVRFVWSIGSWAVNVLDKRLWFGIISCPVRLEMDIPVRQKWSRGGTLMLRDTSGTPYRLSSDHGLLLAFSFSVVQRYHCATNITQRSDLATDERVQGECVSHSYHCQTERCQYIKIEGREKTLDDDGTIIRCRCLYCTMRGGGGGVWSKRRRCLCATILQFCPFERSNWRINSSECWCYINGGPCPA
jgi:hypothetical protein